MRRLALALALVLGVVLFAAPLRAQTVTNCPPGQQPHFAFGFEDLKTHIGDAMGDPVTCEFPDPNGTGDVHQRTTTGLAFWRKSTNTPTFTDGYHHWGLTPDGWVEWTGESIDPPAPVGQSAPPAPDVVAPAEPTAAPTATPRPAPREVQVERVLWAPLSSGNTAYVTAAALVRNPNTDLWLPSVPATMTAYDAAGTVLATDQGFLALGPGEERWVVVAQMAATPSLVARVDYQVRRNTEFRAAAIDPSPGLVVVQSTLQVGQFSSQHVGQVRNDGSRAITVVRVDVVDFGSQGQLLGTAVAYVYNLAPGQTASFSARSYLKAQPADSKTYATAPFARLAS